MKEKIVCKQNLYRRWWCTWTDNRTTSLQTEKRKWRKREKMEMQCKLCNGRGWWLKQVWKGNLEPFLFFYIFILFFLLSWKDTLRENGPASASASAEGRREFGFTVSFSFIYFLFCCKILDFFLLGRFSTLWGPICSLRVQPLPSFHYNHYFIFKLTPVCSSKIGIINSFVMFVW